MHFLLGSVLSVSSTLVESPLSYFHCSRVGPYGPRAAPSLSRTLLALGPAGQPDNRRDEQRANATATAYYKHSDESTTAVPDARSEPVAWPCTEQCGKGGGPHTSQSPALKRNFFALNRFAARTALAGEPR